MTPTNPKEEPIIVPNPDPHNKGNDATERDAALSKLEEALAAASAAHGPDSPQAESARRALNHARYVK